MESKKIIQMNVYAKQKHAHRYRKQTSSYQRGEGRREGQITCMGLRLKNYYV